MTTATTDTPRTDALDFGWGVHTGEIWDLSRQLERELAASKAEVERLKELVNESILEKSNLSIAPVNCQADLSRAKMETAHLFWEEMERSMSYRPR